MNIEFTKLHIENFMSIGEITIDFSNYAGFNLISGENNSVEDNAKSNGSGKSSVFEALVWGLTGETIRGNKDVVNHFSSGGTFVSVEFNYSGNKYSILRYKDHKEYKTNLFVCVNGEDKSGKGIRDSQKLLEEYLPELTPSLIGSVVVLGQGLPSRFTNNTPSARKEVLEKLTNSDFMIEDIKKRIASRKEYLSDTLHKAQDEILRQETSIRVYTQTIDKSRLELSQLDDISTLREAEGDFSHQLVELEESLDRYRAECDEALGSYTNATTELSGVEVEEHEDILSVKAQYSDKIMELEVNISTREREIASLKNEIQSAKNIKDICPTCGQKLNGVHRPDTTESEQRLQDMLVSLEVEKQRASDTRNEMNSRIDEIKQSYYDKKQTLSNSVYSIGQYKQECNKKKTGVEFEIIKVRDALNNVSLKIAQYEGKLQSLNNAIADSEEEIKKCEEAIKVAELHRDALDSRLKIVTKFETIAKRDFRGYLLQDIIVYIDNRAKEYCKQVFGTSMIDFQLDGNAISISYNGKQYEALSGGERQKLDIIIQLSIRDVLCAYSNFSSNIIVLDEIFDNLDDVGSGNIVELIYNNLKDISGMFIISHHSKELNIPYDNELRVVKNESGVSYLI